jgi:hypothetical protein
MGMSDIRVDSSGFEWIPDVSGTRCSLVPDTHAVASPQRHRTPNALAGRGPTFSRSARASGHDGPQLVFSASVATLAGSAGGS